jgi:hypothetical protein
MRIEGFQPQYTRRVVQLWRRSFEHGVGIILAVVKITPDGAFFASNVSHRQIGATSASQIGCLSMRCFKA